MHTATGSETVENRTSDFPNRTTDSVGPDFSYFEEFVFDLRGTFLKLWRTHLDGQDERRSRLINGLRAKI